MNLWERHVILPVLIFFFSLTSCTSNSALPTLNAEHIRIIGENCKALYQGQIDAWDSRHEENLKAIYTDDIVHFDGRPLFIGIDAVVSMAEDMYRYLPGWQMEAGETFVSEESCFGTWINWGVFGFTAENPGLEYDLLEYQDKKISFWQLFYSQAFHQAINFRDPVDDAFLLQYAATWSSRNARDVTGLYAEDAGLEDTLHGIMISGKQSIRDYVNGFFSKSSKAQWELVLPFAESEVESIYKDQYPFASQGGVFSISVRDEAGNPCEIVAVVILTPDENGNIQYQKTFYESNSLISCGWAK
jgi:ketosteroid isomerase-like protein